MKSPRKAVAIVGAGPVGLTLANLLGVHGVSTVLLERKPETVDEPRAIAIDAEALRTLQGAGLYDAVAPDMLLGFRVDYVNGRGRPLFSIELSRTPYGHAQQNSFDQPLLERQLRAGLARFPHVEVRFGHELDDFRETPEGVELRGRSADGEGFTLAADWLVGCDGGRSAVRQRLGIEMRGRTAPQRWLVIDTLDPHLAGSLECRFFCDPSRPAMTLRKQHGKRRWEWMLLPGESDDALLDDATIRRLLAPHTRVEQVTIERKCIYTFHSIVADRYRSGRVLLAGDAAHMMPPFAGQGMNGGIRDALNLSWKLALVARGLAGEGLLDSYQEERRGHVIAATDLANRLGGLIQPTSRVRAALRDGFFALLRHAPGGRAAFDRFLVGSLRVPSLRRGVFVTPGAGAGSLVGRFLVQPEVRRADGSSLRLDEVLGPWFAVVGYGTDPEAALDPESRAFWRRLGARFVHVLPRGRTLAGEAVEDASGGVGEWFAASADRLAVIRPDKFCAAQLGPATAAPATAAFAELLGTRTPGAGTAPLSTETAA